MECDPPAVRYSFAFNYNNWIDYIETGCVCVCMTFRALLIAQLCFPCAKIQVDNFISVFAGVWCSINTGWLMTIQFSLALNPTGRTYSHTTTGKYHVFAILLMYSSCHRIWNYYWKCDYWWRFVCSLHNQQIPPEIQKVNGTEYSISIKLIN